MAKPKRKRGVTALSPQNEDPLWTVLDAKIGGRTGLLEAALASANPKAAALVELCLDKAFAKSGTKALAKRAGMEADEIVDLYRNRKWLEATLALHEHLPDIIDGAADDAKPKMTPCPECKAKGVLDSGDVCWVCGGSRAIRRAGDKDKLKFIGDAVGLTGKVAPQNQNNIQINTPGAVAVSFEDLVRRASVQVNRPKQIEAIEVVKDYERDPISE